MWSNWSGGQHCAPAAVERPGSRAEVVAAVRRAASGGRRIRVAGAGHSFSDAVVTDGSLLLLDRLDRVLDVDPASGRVRVEAGVRLSALNLALHARGLALPNLGDIDAQSLAGAMATATHGTGGRLPNLSAQVEAMELVLADGSERTLTAADGDLLRAARVGLGALGVVVAVTLRCVPAFRLHAVDEPVALAGVLAELDARVDAADHFELWSFPHSGRAITRTNQGTAAPAQPPGAVRRWLDETLVENHALDAINRAGRRVPRAVPWLNRAAGAAVTRRERTDESFRVFATERRVRFEEMEYAVPREHARAALETCREVLSRHPVGFPIELRFSASDDAPLSMAYGRDTAYVAVHVYAGVPFEAPLRQVEAAMRRYDGRPHWGKRTFLTAAELAPLYPRWAAFARARSQLDPEGRFGNAFIDRVLGPSQEGPALPAIGRDLADELPAGR